jgi:polygalacturonase
VSTPRGEPHYTAVTVKTPHGPATITGTANHPYWDATTHRWTPANKLHVGDNLQTSDGALVTVAALRDYSTSMVTYDLTIDTLHDYYIEADTTPLLVHNDDVSCPPPASEIPSAESLTNSVAEATGGTVSVNKGGYTVSVPHGKRGIIVRVQREGGSRTDYYRVSVPGLNAYDVTGSPTTDRGRTHIPIGPSSLRDIVGIVNKIQGG